MSNQTSMWNLGAMLGHVWRAIRQPVESTDSNRPAASDDRITMRRTTIIDEVSFPAPGADDTNAAGPRETTSCP